MLMVTGATGDTGQHFLQVLQNEKYEQPFKCFVRSGNRKVELLRYHLNLQVHVGDLNDAESIERAMDDVDIILHIAGIQYTPSLVSAAVRYGVKRIICIHTTGIYSQFRSASKGYQDIEKDIVAYRSHIEITILRPTMIYGSENDKNIHKLITYLSCHRFFPIFGSGRNMMQPVHEQDLARAYYDVLIRQDETRNREYNLSGGAPIMYRDMIKIIIGLLNRIVFLFPVPFWVCLPAAQLWNWLRPNSAFISVEQVLRMKEDKVFSFEDAARDFGYNPRDFKTGVAQQINE